jgi:4-alpha-glucanotransferase
LTQPLDQLASAFGVITSYHDIDGTRRRAAPEALVAVLRALGAPLERTVDAADALRAIGARAAPLRVEPIHVIREGTAPAIRLVGRSDARAQLVLRREDGSFEEWSAVGRPVPDAGVPATSFAIDCPLPWGLHELTLEFGPDRFRTSIVHAPRLAPAPSSRRSWGVFAPMHAYGDRVSGGVPTYSDLTRLARWIAASGAEWISTLPLLASFLDEPFEPSPYVPASRLFWNDLYIDAARAPGADYEHMLPAIVPDSGDFVDYRCVADAQHRILRAAARRFFDSGGERDPAFRGWMDAHSRAAEYARFRSLCDRFRQPFDAWPAPLPPDVLDAESMAESERFHAWAAWVADRQIADISSETRNGAARLYLDLPLGVHRSGFDTWHEPALFASGISVGAPPDPFFRAGQNWGFPPLDPSAMRMDGLRYIRDCLRHHLESAGMLRLDHVMSLERLFWIPEGMPAVEGVYVRYPRDELIALLTLEAHRHGAVIVGEDLGTVTPEIRQALAANGILRMYVAQFEFAPESDPPIAAPAANTVAALNTHDLPTFAAFWGGLDIEDQVALGQLDEVARDRALAERDRLRTRLGQWAGAEGLAEDDAARRVLLTLLDWIAASDAAIHIVNLEDLWLETRPQNTPGTTVERPNWRRRAKHDVASLVADTGVAEQLVRIDARRRGQASRSPS